MADESSMTKWGVGPRLCAYTVAYGIVISLVSVFVLDYSFPVSGEITFALGMMLIFAGFIVYVLPSKVIHSHFLEKKLATTGIYSVIRDPIYGAWIVFILPGIALALNSLLWCSVPLLMYVLYRQLIPEEEQYLENAFGKEYLEYKKKVGGILPKLRRRD